MAKTKHVKLEITLSTDSESLRKLEATFEEDLYQYCGDDFVMRKINLTSEQVYKKILLDSKLVESLRVQAKEKGFANADDYVNDLVNQLVKTPTEDVLRED